MSCLWRALVDQLVGSPIKLSIQDHLQRRVHVSVSSSSEISSTVEFQLLCACPKLFNHAVDAWIIFSILQECSISLISEVTKVEGHTMWRVIKAISPMTDVDAFLKQGGLRVRSASRHRQLTEKWVLYFGRSQRHFFYSSYAVRVYLLDG